MKTESWTVTITVNIDGDAELLQSKRTSKGVLLLQWIQERLEHDDAVVTIENMQKRWKEK